MTSIAPDSFEAVTAPCRRELLAHCYRMTGSAHDAEDLVQETYLRAWRAFDRFEARSSVRTWLYRIATNACLTALHPRRRRVLPSGLGPPSADPHAAPAAPPSDVAWLEPIPDQLLVDERGDPADVVASRQSVRLALVAAAQVLPARQRAAFVLCDVCAQPGAEAAEVLGVSVAALKSLLQRARARLEQHTVSDEQLAEPTDGRARRVLDRYMAAFEDSDMPALERLLADDTVLEMTGTTTWYSGKSTCVPFIAAQGIGRTGDWRMLPLHVNGQLGAASYRLGTGGRYHPFAIVVLATTTTHLRHITLFGEPALFERFELPATVS
ncbi:MAG TPA: RNA polymerase subunit sigma-70 [Solirubrobacteraceae bacterium]|jgi:RNA polymerase sigma-70 factor (ECF subfamily)